MLCGKNNSNDFMECDPFHLLADRGRLYCYACFHWPLVGESKRGLVLWVGCRLLDLPWNDNWNAKFCNALGLDKAETSSSFLLMVLLSTLSWRWILWEPDLYYSLHSQPFRELSLWQLGCGHKNSSNRLGYWLRSNRALAWHLSNRNTIPVRK